MKRLPALLVKSCSGYSSENINAIVIIIFVIVQDAFLWHVLGSGHFIIFLGIIAIRVYDLLSDCRFRSSWYKRMGLILNMVQKKTSFSPWNCLQPKLVQLCPQLWSQHCAVVR